MSKAMRGITIALALATMSLAVHGEPASHPDEIAAFATLMANVRTASERCGLVIVQDRITAAKDGLHIQDVDYFAFRQLAASRADAIAALLVDRAAEHQWCDQQLGLYGAKGAAVPGALRR